MRPTKKNLFIVKYWGNRCAYCMEVFDTRELTIDHFIPQSKGGSGLLSNLVPACMKCNTKKCNTSPAKFCSVEQLETISRYFKALHILTFNSKSLMDMDMLYWVKDRKTIKRELNHISGLFKSVVANKRTISPVLKDIKKWLKDNYEQYRGKWVAFVSGIFWGTGTSKAELKLMVGRLHSPSQTIIIKIH